MLISPLRNLGRLPPAGSVTVYAVPHCIRKRRPRQAGTGNGCVWFPGYFLAWPAFSTAEAPSTPSAAEQDAVGSGGCSAPAAILPSSAALCALGVSAVELWHGRGEKCPGDEMRP